MTLLFFPIFIHFKIMFLLCIHGCVHASGSRKTSKLKCPFSGALCFLIFFETAFFTGQNMLNKLLWLISKTQGATSQEQHYIAIQQFWFGLYIVSLETIIVLYFEMSVIRYVYFEDCSALTF